MLYDVLSRMIQRGETEGLRGKIDVFYAAARLTDEEYTGLCDLLAGDHHD